MDDNFDKPCEGFPIRDEVEDFAGKNRVFQIMCYNLGYGYTLIASEEGKDGLGYEFQDFSEIGPYSALGDLRGNHLIKTDKSYLFTEFSFIPK